MAPAPALRACSSWASSGRSDPPSRSRRMTAAISPRQRARWAGLAASCRRDARRPSRCWILGPTDLTARRGSSRARGGRASGLLVLVHEAEARRCQVSMCMRRLLPLVLCLVGGACMGEGPAVIDDEAGPGTGPDSGDLPGPGEPCGPDDRCAPDLSCLHYQGSAGDAGPAISTCELPCTGGTCPPGMTCVSIHPAPGSVCRPLAPSRRAASAGQSCAKRSGAAANRSAQPVEQK